MYLILRCLRCLPGTATANEMGLINWRNARRAAWTMGTDAKGGQKLSNGSITHTPGGPPHEQSKE